MNLVNVSMPLVAGIFMVVCPEMFYNYHRRPMFPDKDTAQVAGKTRKIGYVFLGAQVLYLLLSWVQRG